MVDGWILNAIRSAGWREFLDIAVVTLLLYLVIVWTKRMKAGSALVGILILGCGYLVAAQTGLLLTSSLLKWFLLFGLVVLAVAFQAEIRRFFE